VPRPWRDEVDELLARDESDANDPKRVWRNVLDLGDILTGFMFSLGIPSDSTFNLYPHGQLLELGLDAEPRLRLAAAAVSVGQLRGWGAITTNAEDSRDYDLMLVELLHQVAHPICIALQENQQDDPTGSILPELVRLCSAIVWQLEKPEDPEPEDGDRG